MPGAFFLVEAANLRKGRGWENAVSDSSGRLAEVGCRVRCDADGCASGGHVPDVHAELLLVRLLGLLGEGDGDEMGQALVRHAVVGRMGEKHADASDRRWFRVLRHRASAVRPRARARRANGWWSRGKDTHLLGRHVARLE